MTDPEPKHLIDPWTICRDIAAMLPAKDEQVALRIIAEHERQHAIAELSQELAAMIPPPEKRRTLKIEYR